MKTKIIAKDYYDLRQIIQKEIKDKGSECDLNHIDVSSVTDMSNLFRDLPFNGNISQWDVSNVSNMGFMFYKSQFNGDISKWNTSNVTDMDSMFSDSKFNSDISQWDVSNVRDMDWMFYNCPFEGDISNWKPYKLGNNYNLYISNIPYWSTYESTEERNKAIVAYHLKKELNDELNISAIQKKNIKI
jgi:surface protein